LSTASAAKTSSGLLHVDTDLSIQLDREELESSSLEALQGLLGASGAGMQVQITYIGKGRRVDSNAFEAPLSAAPPSSIGSNIDGFSAFNPNSGNEFRIQLTRSDLGTIGSETTRVRRDGSLQNIATGFPTFAIGSRK